MFTCMHVHPFCMWSLSLSICALRHSSGWRTRLQESWRGRSGWSAFNDHQGPQTCTRNPRRSTVSASIQHRLHLTSLYFTQSSRGRHTRPLLPTPPALSTPQAATTSANRKRDAPSPRAHQHLSSLVVHRLRPHTSTRVELVAIQTSVRHRHRLCRPQSVSVFFLFSRLSEASKQPRHSSLRPQLY
jgi:hypothetical protein